MATNQGGTISDVGSIIQVSVTFPITFKDTSYIPLCVSSGTIALSVNKLSASQMRIDKASAGGYFLHWLAIWR